MTLDFIPYDYGRGTIREIADMYKNPFAFSRETASNVKDASVHPNAKGKPVECIFLVSKIDRQIIVLDHMTGIMDIKDFLIIGTKSTSRDVGKTVGDQVSSYNNVNPDIIGQKHFGKASCLYASESGNVEYFSNNGKNGHYLHSTYEGWEPFDMGLPERVPFQITDKNKHLVEPGLMIKINNVKPLCLSKKNLFKNLAKWFGVVLAKGKMKILIIDVDKEGRTIEVEPFEDLLDVKNEYTDKSLMTSRKIPITVNLVATDQPFFGNNIDIYQKEIYVTSIHLPYMCKGYVNYDGLELDPPRQHYKDDPDFVEVLDQYTRKNFKSEFYAKDKPLKQKTQKQLEDFISEVIVHMNKVDSDLLPLLSGKRSSTGIKGKSTKQQQEGEGDNEWVEVKVDYTDDASNDLQYIAIGDGVIDHGPGGGGGGTDKGPTINDDGIKKVKIKNGDSDQEEFIAPDIEVLSSQQPGHPTIEITQLIVGNKSKLLFNINSANPASKTITKPHSTDIQRDLTYDKIVDAILMMKHADLPAREFKKKSDEIWNSLYQARAFDDDSESQSEEAQEEF